MRLAICGAGGEVRFHSQVTDIVLDETSLVGVQVNQEEELETDTVILQWDTAQEIHLRCSMKRIFQCRQNHLR